MNRIRNSDLLGAMVAFLGIVGLLLYVGYGIGAIILIGAVTGIAGVVVSLTLVIGVPALFLLKRERAREKAQMFGTDQKSWENQGRALNWWVENVPKQSEEGDEEES